MAVDSLLRVFLHRLVKNAVPSSFGIDQTTALFEELTHLIESGAETATHYNLDEVISDIQPHLSTNSWQQFQRNVEQLLKYKDRHSVARYLSLLKKLIVNNYIPTPATNDNHDPLRNLHNRENSPSALPHYDNFERNSFFAGSEYQHSLHGQTIDSFENTNFDRFSDRRSVYSTALTNREPRMYTFREILIPYFENQMADTDFLKAVCYTLAGTTSDVLPLEGATVLLPDNISNGLSGELHNVLEAGLIYLEISAFVLRNKANRNSQTKTAALCFIQEQLDKYLGFINDLSSYDHISLKSVYADIYDELIKLRFLMFLLKKVNSLRSYEILSVLHEYTKHGDQAISQCSLEFLNYCVSTFSSALFIWLFDGELTETFEDFFIATDSDSSKFDFQYEKQKIPSFFSGAIAQKIYNIGLTIRFMKLYCKEVKWISDFSEKMKLLFQRERFNTDTNDISLWNHSKTHQLISKFHNQIINYFNYIIHTKFHYFEIISALNDYLLMCKGDFIESLVQNGSEVLNEPSNSLSGHQLSNLLRESVLRTTSRYDLSKSNENYILNNLDARLLSVGHGNIGWDVFTLDYRIGPPLNIVLSTGNSDFKKDYLRVFNHLWKIKRLDYLYSEVWKETKLFRREFRDKKFKRLKLVQNFVHSFIKSIKSYILIDVIKKQFEEFIRKLRDESGDSQIELKKNDRGVVFLPKILKPNHQYLQELNGSDVNSERFEHGFNEFTIDELNNVHHEFLSSIIKHKLVNGSDSSSRGKVSGKSYVGQLNNLINIAFRFILVMKELHGVKYDSQNLVPDINMLRREGNIYDNLFKLFQEFNTELKMFVNDLNSDDDLELRYLGVSLNQ